MKEPIANSRDPRTGAVETRKVLSEREAKQGSNRLENYRVLKRSMLIAVIIGVSMLIVFYATI